jgi:hypothetical protein
MNVDEWQTRLEEHFTENGIIGGKLVDIIKQERECGNYVIQKYHGQRVLIDSFFSFFIETLEKAIEIVQSNGWPENKPYYGPYFLYYLTLFRSFRAAENLFTIGYPLDGYALLRDIKDRTIFIAAIAQDLTSLPKILGIRDKQSMNKETYKKIKKERKEEEFKVLNKMIRKDSGLDQDVINELHFWEQFFNEEVHGSKLSYFSDGGEWIMGKRQLSIGPVPVERANAMYMNRSSEIGWLITRIFPLLQLEPLCFGNTWANKLSILDDSFRIMIMGLENLKKKIATAFMTFVDKKFSFTANSHYVEK